MAFWETKNGKSCFQQQDTNAGLPPKRIENKFLRCKVGGGCLSLFVDFIYLQAAVIPNPMNKRVPYIV